MLWHISIWFFYPFFSIGLSFSVFKVNHMTATSILIGLNDFIFHLDMLQDLIGVFFGKFIDLNVFIIYSDVLQDMIGVFFGKFIDLNIFIIYSNVLQDLIRVFLSCKKIDVFRIHAKHQYHIVLDDSRVRSGGVQSSKLCKVSDPFCNLWILTELQSQLLETLSCFALKSHFLMISLIWCTFYPTSVEFFLTSSFSLFRVFFLYRFTLSDRLLFVFCFSQVDW